MKIIYKNVLNLSLSILVSMLLSVQVIAQRTSSGGGSRSSSGGGGVSSGGGSVSSAPRAPSGAGNVGFSRPSGSGITPQRSVAPQAYNNSGVRASGNYAPARGNNGYVQRQGYTPNTNRGNYGYAPRQSFSPARGSYNYAPRVGISASPRAGTFGGSTYRTSPQLAYGGSYWGNHGYYHYNQGYYNSFYLSRLGYSCGYLPYGYFPFYYGDSQYYFSDGLFYAYDNNQYTVVEPPVGAEIAVLPDKAQSIVINGQQYYEMNGVYYEPYTKDDGTVVYQVAGKDGELNTKSMGDDQQQPQGPQMGDVVNQLPPDCRKLKVNGQKLFVSPDGVYYQQQVDGNNNKTYKIVGLPSDEPEQSQGANQN